MEISISWQFRVVAFGADGTGFETISGCCNTTLDVMHQLPRISAFCTMHAKEEPSWSLSTRCKETIACEVRKTQIKR